MREGRLTERAGDEEARAVQKRRGVGGIEVARHVDDTAMLLPGLEGRVAMIFTTSR